MSLEQAGRDLVAFAQHLERDGLALGSSGNLSVRSGDYVAITPSAVPYEELSPDLICLVDLHGSVRHEPAKVSTELPMHLAAYRETSATAVVHTHPPFATTLSTIVDELPAIHYLIAFLGGPVRVVPYSTPGTDELAAGVAAGLKDRNAVLLQNHGALTIGPSLKDAYDQNRLLEWLCALYYRAATAGDPRILTDAELEIMVDELRHYGSPNPA